jgi:subfamily B ATP-binding cassette protein HlyB/CyaB
MFIAVVIRLLGLIEPFVFQTLIDRVLPFQREASLTVILFVLLATLLFVATLTALISYLGNHMTNRLIADLGGRIFRHVLSLPLPNLQRWPVGETLARIGETDTARSFLTGTMSTAVLDLVFSIIYICALLAISPSLTVVVLLSIPLQMIVFAIIGPFLRQRMQKAFLANSHHQSRLVEAFNNITVIKALAGEERYVSRFEKTLDKGLEASFSVAKLDIVNGFFGQIFGKIPSILIIFLGSQLVFQNEITLGELIAFHLLASHVFGPIASLASIWEKWQAMRVARIRLGDFLNAATEQDVLKPNLAAKIRPTIRMEGVSFSYVTDHPVLKDFSAEFGIEKPTLIVGDSGCGKSTLGKLVAGLYKPDAGKVAIDGEYIDSFDPRSVRQQIAYLPQEAVLFSGTVRDNLLLAKPDATVEEIEKALQDSASFEIVARLPGGLDAQVGEEGGFLSGGQRQRIALARALLSDPSALVLDEPTSALDAQTAIFISQTLRRISKEKTLIVITHNPDLLGSDVHKLTLVSQGRSDASPTIARS